GTYSKGMARRIGLAQALINDPDLLILDEPTTGLDPVGTRQIKDVIETLGGRGKTVILCSHLLADVEDVCDRVAIMYGGRRQAMRDKLQTSGAESTVGVSSFLTGREAGGVSLVESLVQAGKTTPAPTMSAEMPELTAVPKTEVITHLVQPAAAPPIAPAQPVE